MRDYTNQDEVTEYTNTTRPEPSDLSLDGEQAPTRDLIAKLPGQKPAPAPAVEDFTLRQFSRFETTSSLATTTTLGDFIAEIKSDKHKAVCDFLRAPDTDKSARDKAKRRRLPGGTLSIICDGTRKSENAIAHSGLFQIDFDLKDNPDLPKRLPKIRKTLRQLDHHAGNFVSPSGGLKVIVAVDFRTLNPASHKHAWQLACEDIANHCNLQYDSQCSDMARLCFMSHDPSAVMIRRVNPLAYVEPAPTPAPQVTHTPAPGTASPSAQESSRTLLRASAWLQKVDAAEEGQSGHSKLLWAAQGLVNGFQLSRHSALSLLWAEYNPRCSPPWDQGKPSDVRDFERKIDQALASPAKAPGWLLGDDKPYMPEPWIASFTEHFANRSDDKAPAQAVKEDDDVQHIEPAPAAPAQAPAESIWDKVPKTPIATPYIDLDEEPGVDDFKAFLKGVPLAEASDLVVISARLKSFKSSIVAAMACSLVAGDDVDCLGLKIRGEGVVLIFDTEQSTKEIQSQSKTMRRRLGVDKTPDRIKIIGLREYAPSDRQKLIKAAIMENQAGGIAAVVVDGASDLCGNVNDPESSSDIVSFLMVAADQAAAPLFGVIHLNHSDRDAMGGGRGHLGKEMERKAKAVICVEKDAEGIGTIYAETTRRQPITKKQGQRVKYCQDAHMVVSIEGTRADADQAEKISDLRDLIAIIINDTGTHVWKYTQLCQAIMTASGAKERTAKRRINELVDSGMVSKTVSDNHYVATISNGANGSGTE